jgi:hypothetical protein
MEHESLVLKACPICARHTDVREQSDVSGWDFGECAGSCYCARNMFRCATSNTGVILGGRWVMLLGMVDEEAKVVHSNSKRTLVAVLVRL